MLGIFKIALCANIYIGHVQIKYIKVTSDNI